MPPKQRTATISADQQRSLINGVNNLVSAAQALGTLLKDLFPETINSNEQVVDSTMEGNATVTELDEDLALQPAAKDTLKAVNAELPTANEHEAQAAIDSFDSSNAMKIDEKIEEPDLHQPHMYPTIDDIRQILIDEEKLDKEIEAIEASIEAEKARQKAIKDGVMAVWDKKMPLLRASMKTMGTSEQEMKDGNALVKAAENFLVKLKNME